MYEIANDAMIALHCALHRSRVTRTHEKVFREQNSLVFYLRGGHRFSFGQEELLAKQGDVVLLPYGACYKNLALQEDTEYYQIEFDLRQNGEKCALCGKPEKFEGTELSMLFKRVYDQYCRGASGRLFCLAGLMEILGQLWQQQASVGIGPEAAIAPVVTYIHSHYDRNTPISQLAEMAFVSVSFLEKAFRKCYGVTPSVYRNRVRTEKAKALLSAGHSIEETALLAGFSDRYHLTKSFRYFTGMTPGAFLRMYRI